MADRYMTLVAGVPTAKTSLTTSAGAGSSGTIPSLNASGLIDATMHPALTGDVTCTAGTVATTVGKVNGATVPASASLLGSNASSQLTSVAVSSVAVPVNSGVAAQYASTAYALTDGSTIALNWNNGNVQKVTLGGNRTFTFSNPIAGARYLLEIIQDGTGSRTLTWPTIKWQGGTAPTLTTTASKTDLISLYYDGTSYFGMASLNF